MLLPVAVKDKRPDLIYFISDCDVFFSDNLPRYLIEFSLETVSCYRYQSRHPAS